MKLYSENIINTEQPYYSGVYVHYLLVHFMVSYLSAEYAIMVSELMYKQYLNEYTNKIGKNKKSMTGGYNVMSKDEYNNNYLKYYKNIESIDELMNILHLV